MLHVMHVITCFEPGGAEHHLLELCKCQTQRGMKVSVVYLKGSGSLASKLDNSTINVNLKLRFYGNPLPILRLKTQIEELAPDIVHAHMPPAELYTFLAMKISRHKPRFVISKHNDEPFFKGIGSSKLASLIARSADHIIAISHAVKRFLAEKISSIDPENMTVIHYGISNEKFLSNEKKNRITARSLLRVSDKTKVIGVIARLVPQKNISLLLRAVSLIDRDDLIVTILGEGFLREDLEREARDFGLSTRVHFMGKRSDIEHLIHAFDVLVLPSVHEGLGLVLLEAMVAEVPIVASRVSAIPEIIEDRTSGLLFDSGNAVQLAQAIQFVLNDEELSVSLVKNARKRVDNKFTLAAMHDATLRVYGSALQSKSK